MLRDEEMKNKDKLAMERKEISKKFLVNVAYHIKKGNF